MKGMSNCEERATKHEGEPELDLTCLSQGLYLRFSGAEKSRGGDLS